MRPLTLLLLVACAGPADPASPGTADSDPSTADAPDPSWWEAEPRDVDGDGYAGDDCDESDRSVNPGAVDDCDGVDSDCNGIVDDAAPGDLLEAIEPIAAGELDGEHVFFDPTLWPEGDEDVVRFYVEDDLFDDFLVSARAYGVPDGADVWLELTTADGDLLTKADSEGDGGDETLVWEGSLFDNASGTYELRVGAHHGSSCARPYTLQLRKGSL